MSVDFSGTGQGAAVPATPGLPYGGFDQAQSVAFWTQVAGQVVGSSSSGNVFNVPTGPVEIRPSSGLANQITGSLDPVSTFEFQPTKTNEEIKQRLLLIEASDPQEYKDFQEKLKRSGYSSVDDLLYGATLVGRDWNEFLDERASSGMFDDGSGPTTTVTTNESNRGQAFTTVNPQFEAGLGRQVRPDEVADFQETLNQFERANPYVTTSGRGFSKTTGGFNPAELARSYVQGQEDYAESQVASNFLGVLDGILADPSNRPGPDLQERMSRMGY